MERINQSTRITVTRTQLITVPESRLAQEPLVLRLKPIQVDKKEEIHVTWDESVIDNEHLGRKKSNCCCIYVPPREWDKPETRKRNEYETEFCRGHTDVNHPNSGEHKEENCF
uniref:E3 ubiquitin-protein ligase PPP1R11 n=1 Tax=Strongyloides venezuelensis TaxID=75913 RepID=A0A0K0EY87_STRVS